MKLELEKYVIEHKADNIVLSEKYLSEKTNLINEKVLGYYPNLQQALLAVLRYDLNNSESLTAKEIIAEIHKCRDEIKALVSDKLKLK